ncbi:MAG: hypothetical protein NCW75_02925 [Phycisphaera sp.]|nr:MAG: hypothetical protein NCW75_02925 [Phycisphaera sp.]
MARWPIQRLWRQHSDGFRTIPTEDLADFQVCILLGSAGSGKTFEITLLEETEKAMERDVRSRRFADIGDHSEGLERRLTGLSDNANQDSVISLDAFDELMVDLPMANRTLTNWIREHLEAKKPRLRLSCRSAVWAYGITDALKAAYGEDQVFAGDIQSLSQEDVVAIARSVGLDGEAFVEATHKAGVGLLAEQPLTLTMLMGVFEDQGALHGPRSKLFADAVKYLARDDEERREEGTGSQLSVHEVLAAAEVLAVCLLTCGRDHVDQSDTPSSVSLTQDELANVQVGDQSFDHAFLRRLRSHGLFDADGPLRFRFWHRQLAEFLAGRRLATLPLHQGRAMLASGLGWEHGVVGPLRETAASAAMFSEEIRDWVAETDPEIIGLSDVADDELRRRAFLGLVGQFERHERTDADIMWRGIALQGLQYAGAAPDIEPLLNRRTEEDEDVLELALEAAKQWGLTELDATLAALALDSTAPYAARVRAARIVGLIGSITAKAALLPLTVDREDDLRQDIKGEALRCNWPDRLSVSGLLDRLTLRSQDNYSGSYNGFLYELEHEDFSAEGNRLAGLSWCLKAAPLIRDHDTFLALTRNICMAALHELDDPAIASALAQVVLAAGLAHKPSPIAWSQPLWPTDVPPPEVTFQLDSTIRRQLLEAIAIQAKGQDLVWSIVMHTPHLSNLEDFTWLLGRALDESYDEPTRRQFALFARFLPGWANSADCVNEWLRCRDDAIIASAFPYPMFIELESEDARRQREEYELSLPRKVPKLSPPPQARVAHVLAKCEAEGPQWFGTLRIQLMLTEEVAPPEYNLDLTATPGWTGANESTKARIVNAAKACVGDSQGDHTKVVLESPRPVIEDTISALLLVYSQEPAWVEGLSSNWWKVRARYFLVELREDSGDFANFVIQRLASVAGQAVREVVLEVATDPREGARHWLEKMLRLLNGQNIGVLESELAKAIEAGEIPENQLREAAQFILSRAPDMAIGSCQTALKAANTDRDDGKVESLAVAMLLEQPNATWSVVEGVLEERPDLRVGILGRYAMGGRLHRRMQSSNTAEAAMSPAVAAGLFRRLIDEFSFETDPPETSGTRSIGPEEAARDLRWQMLNWLSSQQSLEAVKEIRSIAADYGDRYPWLRRTRSEAEQGYRLAVWTPLQVSEVAGILSARDKRLVRSGSDAVEGIVTAIDAYGKTLQEGTRMAVDDLWDRPRQQEQSPKDEERVSEKVQESIENYFKSYAVVANREVKVRRRILPKELKGLPGSELDVLVTIAAQNTVELAEINIPVEVKWSHNAEAKTNLKAQLLERYMKLTGWPCGVYVVAWSGKHPGGTRRSKWDTIEEARTDLAEQAAELRKANPWIQRLEVVVIDASLR